MLKISYAGGLGLSPAILAQFTLEMRVAAQNCAKNLLNPFWKSSRSFKVIDVDKFKRPVTSACYDKQHVCTYLPPFCLLYTSPSPRDRTRSRMPSSA